MTATTKTTKHKHARLSFRMAPRLTLVIFFVSAILYAVQVPAFESTTDNPAGGSAGAGDMGRLTLVVAPYVYHTHGGHHNDTPWLAGLEWLPAAHQVELGAAYFRNSFYQDSVYLYVGKRWFISDNEQGPFVHLTGGPLYGYRGAYEDKVPFNHHGFGLAIIPSIGYQYRSVNVQLVALGTAGLLFTFGYDFPR